MIHERERVGYSGITCGSRPRVVQFVPSRPARNKIVRVIEGPAPPVRKK